MIRFLEQSVNEWIILTPDSPAIFNTPATKDVGSSSKTSTLPQSSEYLETGDVHRTAILQNRRHKAFSESAAPARVVDRLHYFWPRISAER